MLVFGIVLVQLADDLSEDFNCFLDTLPVLKRLKLLFRLCHVHFVSLFNLIIN